MKMQSCNRFMWLCDEFMQLCDCLVQSCTLEMHESEIMQWELEDVVYPLLTT